MRDVDEKNRRIIRGLRDYSVPLTDDPLFSKDENLLVTAGAGSGKTSVLIERMVALVRTGLQLSELTAITFTRKAAGELRGRFRDELKRAKDGLTGALQSSKTAEQKKAIQAELDRVSSALNSHERPFIDTIHSFCHFLLRENPIHCGLPADFSLIDDFQEKALRRQFWNRYVTVNQDGERGWQNLKVRTGLSPADLFEYFGDRANVHYLSAAESRVDEPDLRDATEAALAYLDRVRELLPGISEIDTFSRLLLEYERFKDIVGLDTCSNRAKFLYRLDRLLDDEGNFRSGVLRVTGWGRKGDRPRDIVEAIRGKERFQGEDLSFPALVSQHIRTRLAAWQSYVHSVAERFVQPAARAYAAERRAQGNLTYDDLLWITKDALASHRAFRTFVRKRFPRILVDEFQDTDPLQAELFFMMTSGDPEPIHWLDSLPVAGSLFLVGDEKQSIYRFRRADIRVFEQVEKRIHETGGRTLGLYSNFRSRGEICSWVNQVMTPLFGSEMKDYQATYEPLNAAGEFDSFPEPVRTIVLEGVNRHSSALIAEKDAATIATCIRDTVAGNGSLDQKLNDVHYGDFLILLRTGARMDLYAEALERVRIPYSTAGAKSLRKAASVAPLIDLIDTILNPHDPVSRLAYLRGPFAGISDATLYQLVKKKGSYVHPTRIPEGLSVEDENAFSEAFETVDFGLRLLRTYPLSHALELLMSQRGLLASFAFDIHGSADVGAVQRLLSLIRTWERAGLSSAECRGELGRVLSGELEQEGMTLETGLKNSVRLYNVHQAKGLESRVVFLADPYQVKRKPMPRLHVDRRGNREELYLPIRKSSGFSTNVLAAPYGWTEAAEEEVRFAEAEDARLLYVACTRAKELLVVSRYEGKNDVGNWSPLNDGLDQIQAPAIRHSDLEQTGAANTGDDSSAVNRVRRCLDLLDEAKGRLEMMSAPSFESTSPARLNELIIAAEERIKYAGTKTGAGFGTAMHILFELSVRRGRVGHSPVPDADDIKRILRAEINGRGQALDELCNAAQSQLSLFLDSDLWRHIQDAEVVHTEVDCSYQEASAPIPTIVTGKIDLVFLKNDAWTIVDYKTDRSEEAALRGKYAGQIDSYARAWKALAASGDVRGGIWWSPEGKWISLSS